MPELPDIDVYVERTLALLRDHTLTALRISSPFLLRSVHPPVSAVAGRTLIDARRLGKRIALGFDEDYWLILHLMVAGRIHWHNSPPKLGSKNRLASFDFDNGSLLLTESGHKKKASLYIVHGDDERDRHDPGGIETLECSFDAFRDRLLQQNRTLKRALTSPALFSGIGNAYSDEILHLAQLSPVRLTSKLAAKEIRRLFDATRETLRYWRSRLLEASADGFPTKVTAFRDGMRVHGRFGEPCPACGAPVQRIRYKSNETNYCANCQNNGKLLADRSLSRLLKDDWPTSLD